MTTNQTIEGVLASRELLESFAAYVSDSPNAIMRARAKELRALLDAPEPCAHEWCQSALSSTPDYCTRCSKDKPQAEPAPVAWASMSGDGKVRDLTRRWDIAKHWLGPVQPLYAEQPAPVADPLAKGFTTLESDCGKYKIVTSFATRDDAWSAYRALVGAKPAPPAHTAYDGFDNGVD